MIDPIFAADVDTPAPAADRSTAADAAAVVKTIDRCRMINGKELINQRRSTLFR